VETSREVCPVILGSVENIIFHVANALRTPVMVVALLALALVIVELGALSVELWHRRGRSRKRAAAAGRAAREALAHGDEALAWSRLRAVAYNGAMLATLKELLSAALSGPLAANGMASGLADYDLRSMKRLERTRILVRAGPALGLMGTLIPLSPALTGLAEGKTAQLTSNLRVAFSVTVLGLLIGAGAFAISLVRDRIYAQDLSEMETVASELDPESAQLRPETEPEPVVGEPEVKLA
jgi:biopolymer transport protein ExbB/TolQ